MNNHDVSVTIHEGEIYTETHNKLKVNGGYIWAKKMYK